jgi:hypothetical protein
MLRKTVDQVDCAIIVNQTFYDPENTKCMLSNIATTQILCFHTPSTEPGRIAAAHHLTKNSRRMSICLGRLQPHGNQIRLGKQP